MGNVRPLKRSKSEISTNRFLELYYWCLQYGEWKDELKYKTDTVGAMKIAELEQSCQLIEQTAIEADPYIYQYLLKAVTQEGVTYGYLKMMMEIPCSHNTYYDRRRKFYWLLDKRKV